MSGLHEMAVRIKMFHDSIQPHSCKTRLMIALPNKGVNNVKNLIQWLFVCLLLPFYTNCLATQAPATDTPPAIKTVAFAQDDMANDFRKAQVFEVRDAIAQQANLRFKYSDAGGKTALLIHQIQQFINQNVDAIIVGTNDAKAVVPVVTQAYQKGIAVIIVDRGIESDQYTTFINSDNIEIGKIGAAFLAKKLNGQGTVLLFEGIQTADVTQLRSQGFMQEMAKHPNIKIIKRTGHYLRRDAIFEMEGVVKANIQVDAIFSESDSMLSGVRRVLTRYKIDPASILMVGCDYTSEAQQAILEGSQTGSVLFPLGGKAAVEAVVKIFAGENIPKHIQIPVQLITQQNARNQAPIF